MTDWINLYKTSDAHLTSTDPLLGRIDEELLQEVHSLWWRVRYNFLQRNRWVFFKCDLIVVWKVCYFLDLVHQHKTFRRTVVHQVILNRHSGCEVRAHGPDFLVGSSQHSEHTAQLLNVILSGEKWRVIQQLPENAAYCPETSQRKDTDTSWM